VGININCAGALKKKHCRKIIKPNGKTINFKNI
jgi:hypothetical protein